MTKAPGHAAAARIPRLGAAPLVLALAVLSQPQQAEALPQFVSFPGETGTSDEDVVRVR